MSKKTQTSKEMDLVRDVIGLVAVIVLWIWALYEYGYFDVSAYIAIQYFAVIGGGGLLVFGLFEMATVGQYDRIFNIIALALTVWGGILAYLGYYELGVTPLMVLIATVGGSGWFVAEVIRD